ncbi:unnamed protein product [Amoebophrya sp. A25]|nr:unnamed protein product [Amoebophrya sp. A25]|eukprot:GSA25T00006538001.1
MTLHSASTIDETAVVVVDDVRIEEEVQAATPRESLFSRVCIRKEVVEVLQEQVSGDADAEKEEAVIVEGQTPEEPVQEVVSEVQQTADEVVPEELPRATEQVTTEQVTTEQASETEGDAMSAIPAQTNPEVHAEYPVPEQAIMELEETETEVVLMPVVPELDAEAGGEVLIYSSPETETPEDATVPETEVPSSVVSQEPEEVALVGAEEGEMAAKAVVVEDVIREEVEEMGVANTSSPVEALEEPVEGVSGTVLEDAAAAPLQQVDEETAAPEESNVVFTPTANDSTLNNMMDAEGEQDLNNISAAHEPEAPTTQEKVSAYHGHDDDHLHHEEADSSLKDETESACTIMSKVEQRKRNMLLNGGGPTSKKKLQLAARKLVFNCTESEHRDHAEHAGDGNEQHRSRGKKGEDQDEDHGDDVDHDDDEDYYGGANNFSDEDDDDAPHHLRNLDNPNQSKSLSFLGTCQSKSGSRNESVGALDRVSQQKFASKISLDHVANNSIANSERKAAAHRQIGISRDSRATVQQCLDDRTLQILHKLLRNGVLEEINGCVSTGKEANVYAATSKQAFEVGHLMPCGSNDASEQQPLGNDPEAREEEDEGGEEEDEDDVDDTSTLRANHNHRRALKSTTKLAASEDAVRMDSEQAASAERRHKKKADEAADEQRRRNKTARHMVNPDKAKRLAKSSTAENAAEETSTTSSSTTTVTTSVDLQCKNTILNHLAVKVFKTSVLVFKDRARYTEGDYRFRHAVSRGNPRKVIAQWCEKEYRNLQRIRQKANFIKVPYPIEHRANVLVMALIGHEGIAAPRLKDVPTEELVVEQRQLKVYFSKREENESNAEEQEEQEELHDLLEQDPWLFTYLQCCRMLRDLFQNCKLVHGDLSEYNILYFNGSLYMIDVSQSVEMDHPQALDFLKRDCQNINSFFQKQGIDVLPLRWLYHWVVDENLGTSASSSARQNRSTVALFDVALTKLKDLMFNVDRDSKDFELEEEFKNTWVPSNLHQISEMAALEKDMDKLDRGEQVVVSNLLADRRSRGDEAGAGGGTWLEGVPEEDELSNLDDAAVDELLNEVDKEDDHASKEASTKKQDSGRVEKRQKHLDKWRAFRQKKRSRRDPASTCAASEGTDSVVGGGQESLLGDVEGHEENVAVEDATTSESANSDQNKPGEDAASDQNKAGEDAASDQKHTEDTTASSSRLLPKDEEPVDAQQAERIETVADKKEEGEEQGSDAEEESPEGDESEIEDGEEVPGEEEEETTEGRKKKPKKLPEGARDPNLSKAEWKAKIKQEKEERRAEKMPKKLKKKLGKK